MMGVALALFAAVFVLRLAVPADESDTILLLEVVPVALVAWGFGVRIGVAAGAVALAAWLVYAGLLGNETVDPAAVAIRGVAFLLPAALIGWLADHDRSTRAALEESARNFRFIAEESSDTISTHTPDGDYTFVSGMCRQMLGYEPEELLGTSPYQYFHPDDLELIQATHAQTLDAPEITTMTYRSRRKDGRYVWFESRMRTFRNPETNEVEEIHCATHEISEREQERHQVERSERKARARIEAVLGGEGLSIAYQPIVDLDSGRTIGAEALSRFSADPGRPPNLWFEEAWSVGLGQQLELAAIAAAIEGAKALPQDWVIAVNASPQTVQAPQLLNVLGGAASRVIVEVTEHAEISDPVVFTQAADFLRGHGVRLAIDDAGSGYSGLRRLLDLNPDIIKLDISLTSGIDHDPRRRALASALIAFATSAEVDVIAEGIETGAELQALRVLGIAFGQGYHLGRPGPIEEIRPESLPRPAEWRLPGAGRRRSRVRVGSAH